MQIRRYNTKKQIRTCRNYLFTGKRESGKSTAMDDMMGHMLSVNMDDEQRAVTEVHMWSATEEANGFWGRRFPASFIHSEFDPDIFKALHARQKKRYIGWTEGGKQGPAPGAVLIMEDMAYNIKKIINMEEFKDICLNGRHTGFTLALITQYLMVIDRSTRSNFDVIVCTEELNSGNIDRVWEDWGKTEVDSKRLFATVYKDATKDHGLLVFDVAGGSVPLMTWYKASLGWKYKAGSKAQWDHHASRTGTNKKKSKKHRRPADSVDRHVPNADTVGTVKEGKQEESDSDNAAAGEDDVVPDEVAEESDGEVLDERLHADDPDDDPSGSRKTEPDDDDVGYGVTFFRITRPMSLTYEGVNLG